MKSMLSYVGLETVTLNRDLSVNSEKTNCFQIRIGTDETMWRLVDKNVVIDCNMGVQLKREPLNIEQWARLDKQFIQQIRNTFILLTTVNIVILFKLGSILKNNLNGVRGSAALLCFDNRCFHEHVKQPRPAAGGG